MASRAARMGLFVALAAATAALDQLSKELVVEYLSDSRPLRVTPFLNLVLAYNRGAAFGFLSDASGWQAPLFIGVALAVVSYIMLHVWREAHRSVVAVLAFGFIVGGALGNLADRLKHGYVVDFIDLHYSGWHFWVFNLADAALSLGVGLLLLGIAGDARRRCVSRGGCAG